jgi:cytochrome c553
MLLFFNDRSGHRFPTPIKGWLILGILQLEQDRSQCRSEVCMLTFARKNAGVYLGLFLSVAAAGCSDNPLPPVSQCPQPRFTEKAPEPYYGLKNPLQSDKTNLKAGARSYLGGTSALSCATCHGNTGDGDGELARQFDPPPRNFACAKTVNGIADGQLFWVIRFGSPGTSMPGHPELGDEQIWQLVLYLRHLAR